MESKIQSPMGQRTPLCFGVVITKEKKGPGHCGIPELQFGTPWVVYSIIQLNPLKEQDLCLLE